MSGRGHRALSACALVMMTLRVADAQEAISTANTSRAGSNGRWDWTAYLRAAPAVLDRIQCVEYRLHPTFPDPVRLVCKRGSGAQPFALTSNGWGTFSIAIKVQFKNGSTQELTHMLSFARPTSVRSVSPVATRAAARGTSSAGASITQAAPLESPRCETLVTFSIPENGVRRLTGSWSNLTLFAEELHGGDKASHFYLVNSSADFAADAERLSGNDFRRRLSEAGIQRIRGNTPQPQTYTQIDLAMGRPQTLDFSGRRSVLSISNPESKLAGVKFCFGS